LPGARCGVEGLTPLTQSRVWRAGSADAWWCGGRWRRVEWGDRRGGGGDRLGGGAAEGARAGVGGVGRVGGSAIKSGCVAC